MCRFYFVIVGPNNARYIPNITGIIIPLCNEMCHSELLYVVRKFFKLFFKQFIITQISIC